MSTNMTGHDDDTLSVFSISSDTSVTSNTPALGEPEGPGTTAEEGQLAEDTPALNSPSDIPLDQRHPRFFTSEEFTTFQVDSVYFNIPTFVLKSNSKKVRKILEREEDLDGELPSLLQDITAVDLERFLAVIFPRNYQHWDATTVDEWSSVLKVAHQWEAESIYRVALSEIEPHATAVDLVVLGARYHIVDWLRKGRIGLCRREEPITLGEATRMGTEEAIRISAARHHIRPSQVRPGVEDSTILPLVEEMGVDQGVEDSSSFKSIRGVEQESSGSMGASSSEKRACSSLVGQEPATHKPQASSHRIQLPGGFKLFPPGNRAVEALNIHDPQILKPQSRYQDHNNAMNPSFGGSLSPLGETSPHHPLIQLAPNNQEPLVIPILPEAQFGPPPPNFVPQSFTPNNSIVPLPAIGVAGSSPSGRTQPFGGASTAAAPASGGIWGSSTSTKRSSQYGTLTNASSQPRTVGTVILTHPPQSPPDDSFGSTGSKKAVAVAASAAPRGGSSPFGVWGDRFSSALGDADSFEFDIQSSPTRKNTQLDSAKGRGGALTWELAGVEGMPGSISPSRGTMPMPVSPDTPILFTDYAETGSGPQPKAKKYISRRR